jgi:hypothetical protein
VRGYLQEGETNDYDMGAAHFRCLKIRVSKHEIHGANTVYLDNYLTDREGIYNPKSSETQSTKFCADTFWRATSATVTSALTLSALSTTAPFSPPPADGPAVGAVSPTLIVTSGLN